MRALENDERRAIGELETIVERAARKGVRQLDKGALERLPQLYRRASTIWARLDSSARSGEEFARVGRVVARSHALLYRDADAVRAPLWRRVSRAVFEEAPRAIRAEWKLVGTLLVAFYVLAAAAFFAVRGDLSLAFSLYDDGAVAHTIEQLEETPPGESFRGNFTFGLGESPRVTGWIFAHNIAVSVLFFGAALVPPLFLVLFATNALMVGTYTALAAHWGQGLAISSILWCHGTIELQMIVLAGAAGLVLVRAWVAPGVVTRREAMRRESRRAAALFAPVAPFLIFSGFLEGFVSPHAETPVRAAVAAGTGLFLIAWVVLGGRRGQRSGADVDRAGVRSAASRGTPAAGAVSPPDVRSPVR